MKHLIILLALFFPLSLAAQTVTLDSVSKTSLCVGDSIMVYYSSRGSFQTDNFFSVQLSDVNGSFATFTNIGHATSTSGGISVVFATNSDLWRVRIIATDPYIISKDTSPDIRVATYPTPSPLSNLQVKYAFGAVGFIGDIVEFKDGSPEPSGSSSLWSFGQDASVQKFIGSSPVVTYPSIGIKTGTLTVSNGTGCLRTATFQITIINCTPVIPASAHIVTGTESGSFPNVWVKAGGNYNVAFNTVDTVYIDQGGSVRTGNDGAGIYYLKAGGSLSVVGYQSHTTIVLTQGRSLEYSNDGYTDTLYCPDLQFDYSKIEPKGVAIEESPLEITTSSNSLHVTNEGAVISALVSNLLGITILSKRENDVLNLDLSALENGVYFAIIESGNSREVRKIAVVH